MNTIVGWHPTRLTDLANYINGIAFKPEDWGKEGLPIVRIEQLKNPNAVADYFDGKLPLTAIIEDGDLIFSWSASLFLRIWGNGRAALNQHLFKVIEKDGVDRRFLKSFIEFYLPALTAASHGSTMQHITRKELDRFRALFPESHPEQTKIAEVLSAAEHAIEQTEALIAKQECIKTGLMQDLLTRGIDEHGEIRSQRTHRFKDSPLGVVPLDWEVKRVAELLAERIILDVQDGNHGELHPKSRDFVDEGIPFIMASDIADGFVDVARAKKITEQQYRRLRIGFAKPGDVLLSHKASIGFVALVPKNLTQIMLTPQVTYYRMHDSGGLNSVYLAQFFQSPRFQEALKNLAKQSTRDYIGILAQQKLYIAYPKRIGEQEQISDVLGQQDSRIIDLKELFNKLQSLRTALMQDLLTGKRRVTALLAPGAFITKRTA